MRERTELSNRMHALRQEVLDLLASVTRESHPEAHVDLTHVARKLERWDHSESVAANVAAEVYAPEAPAESTEEPAA